MGAATFVVAVDVGLHATLSHLLDRPPIADSKLASPTQVCHLHVQSISACNHCCPHQRGSSAALERTRSRRTRDVIFSGQNSANKCPKCITSHDVLEPLEQALSASRDVIIFSQICGSKLQRVFTLGGGCWLPTLERTRSLRRVLEVMK